MPLLPGAILPASDKFAGNLAFPPSANPLQTIKEKHMQRRVFIRNASLGLAAATGAAAVPTLTWAEDLPTIKWRMASSVPKTLDTIYGVAEVIEMF